jgi:hypothetical protein
MAHFRGLAVLRGVVRFGNRIQAHGCESQLIAGSALYQQWNEIAQLALVEPRVYVLDDTGNVLMRKFRVLLGKTMLYRIDLCPLF